MGHDTVPTERFLCYSTKICILGAAGERGEKECSGLDGVDGVGVVDGEGPGRVMGLGAICPRG